MRLYFSPTSPFVRKVAVTLIETGLDGRVTRVPGSGTPIDPGRAPLHANPLGKVPALELDDGRVLYDSRIITRYLDQISNAGLYPTDAREWDTAVVESTAEGILDAALLILYETRLRPAEMHYAPWVDGQWAKISRALDVLDQRWITHLSGPLDAGHIAVGCALGYLDFRLAPRGWRDGRAALAAWFDTFGRRASMQATAPVDPVK